MWPQETHTQSVVDFTITFQVGVVKCNTPLVWYWKQQEYQRHHSPSYNTNARIIQAHSKYNPYW